MFHSGNKALFLQKLTVLKRAIFLSICIGFALSVYAQQQLPPVTNYTPQDYGENQPIENYSICRDERGFIYAGNVGGVLEYDGVNWNFIEIITGTKVSALFPVGNYAIACGGLNFLGIIRPDKAGKLKYHSLKHLVPDENFEVITIGKVGNKVIFQTENALYVFENGKMKAINTTATFFRSYVVGDRYFVRERGKGLMEMKGDELDLFASDSISSGYGFMGMVEYDKDYFLAITHDVGFYLMHKNTGVISLMESFYLMDNFMQVYDVLRLKNGHFALATKNKGVVVVDDQLEGVSVSGRNEGLRTSIVNQICMDNSNNIWAATENGISMIDVHSPLHFYSESSGLPGNVEAVEYIGTNFYAGTSAGLFLLPESKSDDLKPWRKIESIIGDVSDLDVNEKDVLVASSNGLFAGTLNTFYLISTGAYKSVKYITERNMIVALTPDILEVYSNDYKLLKKIMLPNHFQRTTSIAFDTTVEGKTRIWIGTVKQGVIRLDISTDLIFSMQIFDELDGVMPGSIYPFNFRNDVIFLTDKGLQYFITEEEIARSLSEEDRKDSLNYRGMMDAFLFENFKLDGAVSGMAVTDDRLYFCLNNKICYFSEDGSRFSSEFATLKLGRINGIHLINNRLWIAAADGAAVYFPSHSKNLKAKFGIFFRKITDKNGQFLMNEFFGSEGSVDVHQPKGWLPEIDYLANTITFELAADYFNRNHPLEYAYYLEGHDTNWSKWTKESKITLHNLHEGEYTLHVKARNIYGVESKEATFTFVILPPWYRTWWAYVLYVIGAIIIIFIAVKIAGYRLKQNNIHLEKIVHERTLEIAGKNEKLQLQNDQILHQKTEITDSINYAKRIQEAILPIKKEIRKVFPDSFVLFKPKDIVSGDFYWFANKENLSIFICADCTGHGVPGAFMSMICTDRLNHTVLEKKILSPSLMLSEVNQGIKRSLKQEDESDLKTKDGMDAAVCTFNHITSELKYAGANRPLWLLRNNELIEYKPTKTAVGGFTPEDQHFDETSIFIKKDDVVYLSTDGYADQFGGPKGKKLMVKAFKELLIKNAGLSFDGQHDMLDKLIEDWRNYPGQDEVIEQVDDICVMGIRF